MNTQYEILRDRLAHNKDICSYVGRLKETNFSNYQKFESFFKSIIENIIIDDNDKATVDNETKDKIKKPSYLNIIQYTKYMTVKIIRLSEESLKDTNMMRRDFGKYEALISLTDKNTASALKGKQWRMIIEAINYIMKNDKVKFVFVEFIGESDRMFRGILNLSEILDFIETNRDKILIKDFLMNLKDALNNAYSLGKAHVAGKVKVKFGDITQKGNKEYYRNMDNVKTVQKAGVSGITTHAKAQLVPDEYLFLQHGASLNNLIVKHTLDKELIEFLKTKISPEETLRLEIEQKDDIIKRLLDKIDKLEK